MVKVVRFSNDIPKLTKANSVVIQGRVVWITKKDERGTTSKVYLAYDFKTKIKLGVGLNKASLISYIEKQDFSIIDSIADKINGVSNENS